MIYCYNINIGKQKMITTLPSRLSVSFQSKKTGKKTNDCGPCCSISANISIPKVILYETCRTVGDNCSTSLKNLFIFLSVHYCYTEYHSCPNCSCHVACHTGLLDLLYFSFTFLIEAHCLTMSLIIAHASHRNWLWEKSYQSSDCNCNNFGFSYRKL